DRAPRSLGREQARHGAVRAAGADEIARAKLAAGTRDPPRSVVVLHDVLDVRAEKQLGAALVEQPVVELVATNEPAAAAHRVLRAVVMHVASAPLPQPARILTRRALDHVPERRRQPARAQLDARELRAIDDR